MTEEEYLSWKSEHYNEWKDFLEEIREKFFRSTYLAGKTDTDIYFESPDADKNNQVYTVKRVAEALLNKNDCCDELIRMHIQSLDYRESPKEDILKEVEFGNKFLTRDKRRAVFLFSDSDDSGTFYECWIEGAGHYRYKVNGKLYTYPNDSCTIFDIVSKCEEGPNEEVVKRVSEEYLELINDRGNESKRVTFETGYSFGWTHTLNLDEYK